MVALQKGYSGNEKACLAIAYIFLLTQPYHEGNKEKAESYLTKILSVDS
jgi:hypothetical protein